MVSIQSMLNLILTLFLLTKLNWCGAMTATNHYFKHRLSKVPLCKLTTYLVPQTWRVHSKGCIMKNHEQGEILRYLWLVSWIPWPTNGIVVKINVDYEHYWYEETFRRCVSADCQTYGYCVRKQNKWVVRTTEARNMRTKYQMFMQFLSRPCVFFNNDDNRVVVDCNYFHSTIQVTGDKSKMKGEFWTSGSI